IRDRNVTGVQTCALPISSVVLVTLLLVFVLWQGSVLPRHKFGFNFFRTSVWDPIFNQFGALPFIYGTLVTAAVSLLIAVPLGIRSEERRVGKEWRCC